MESKTPNWLTAPVNILSGLQTTIKALIDDVTWGKATYQSILTVEDIENWFYDLPLSVRQKTDRGAVIRIDSMDEDVSIRLYQGVFDQRWNCLSARQLKIKEISKELEKLFSGTDMLIYAKDPEKL